MCLPIKDIILHVVIALIDRNGRCCAIGFLDNSQLLLHGDQDLVVVIEMRSEIRLVRKISVARHALRPCLGDY